MNSYFYLFIRFSAFFLFYVKMQTKQDQTAIIGCNLSKKHKLTLYKTQNGESNYVDQNFSLIFTRTYLPIQNLGDRHPNTIELASIV